MQFNRSVGLTSYNVVFAKLVSRWSTNFVKTETLCLSAQITVNMSFIKFFLFFSANTQWPVLMDKGFWALADE
jgi:hypothetical protein